MRPFLIAMLVFTFLVSWHPTTATTDVSGAVCSSVALAAAPSADITMFTTEQAAQKHCPSDVVVWLNTTSGIYHLKGERWHGLTKHGAYVCKKEADAAGYRETRNGQ